MEWIPIVVIAVLALIIVISNIHIVQQSRAYVIERLGAFTYSPEEITKAAKMPNQIDEETKTRRLDQLMMLQQAISMELNEARIGEKCEVLVDGFDEDGRPYGRSLKEAPESDGVIRFTAAREVAPGEYLNVKITGADAYDLFGEEYR